MFAHDLSRDFYVKIKGQRVLVIVNYDVDAICACKILQALFRTDYISYTMVTVDFTKELKLMYEENHADEKYVIFINCGATLDLVEEIEPEENIVFFILDSHRPIDVCNIYNESQVVLLSELENSESVPEFDDIFKDEDSENESSEEINEEEQNFSDENEENPQSKRRKISEDAIQKKRERKLWEEKRDKLLFEYTQFAYHGKSSALILFELAWKLSKDNFDVLWYAIVGLSEQYLMNKITESMYVTECGNLQIHVSRLTHDISQKNNGESLPIHVELEKDLRLSLYRHWTVKDSLKHSKFTASRLKLWTFQGEERLHEMLAEIGIPLNQCKQKFASMDLIYRKEFFESVVKMSEKYSLSGIVFVTFFIQYGYRKKYSAADYVYALLALLQSTTSERAKASCFIDCLEALSQTKKEKLDHGIELGKNLFISIFKQTQNALEIKRVQRVGPFLYFLISQKFAQTLICRHPHGTILLADFLLTAYAATRKNVNKALASPMVICSPCLGEDDSLEENENSLCNVAGIPPIGEESNKNFFGKAFEQAAQHCRIQIRNTYFDSSVIQLEMKDISKFLDALVLLLS